MWCSWVMAWVRRSSPGLQTWGNKGRQPVTQSQSEEAIKKKYGGMLPKKPSLISKDHEHAYFDSANLALGWVDNHLLHVLSPNIYQNTSESLGSFDYIIRYGYFSFMGKITVKYAEAMYFVSKNLKKKYNITDECAALYEADETWVDALNGQEEGLKPNLADLAVFGVETHTLSEVWQGYGRAHSYW